MNTSINETINNSSIISDNFSAITENKSTENESNIDNQSNIIDTELEEIKKFFIGVLNTLNQSDTVPEKLINYIIEKEETENEEEYNAKHKDFTTLFLKVIGYIIDDFQTAEIEYRHNHITMLFILAKFREQKAFPYIIKIASLYRDWPEKFLGDVRTEGLASLLISTYNGDLPAIKNIIENQYADLWCRIACLNSLKGLFETGKLERQELIDYYTYLLDTTLIEDGDFVSFLVSDIISMYPVELKDKIDPLFDKEYFDLSLVTKEMAEEALSLGLDECLKENIYSNKFIKPVNNVVEHVSWLYRPQEDEDEEDDEKTMQQKIGRNDPCPCDSGKKYKKCCLGISSF